MSINGTSEVGPVELPLDIDFKDGVLENLDAIFTVHFEAKKKDLTIFTEYQYADPLRRRRNKSEMRRPALERIDQLGVEHTLVSGGLGNPLSRDRIDHPRKGRFAIHAHSRLDHLQPRP